MPPPLLIAIDGTAGAGKGTLARRVAQFYNLAHLDTGLLYRALGQALLERNMDPSDPSLALGIAHSLESLDLTHPALRDEEVGIAASHVATFSEVRKRLLAYQKSFARQIPEGKKGCVMDGRDIGRVVFPEALCKIYVTATSEVRAHRRFKELQEKGISSIYEHLLKDIEARDERDRTRKTSPLYPAEDAFILETSHITIEEVFHQACGYVNSKYGNPGKSR